MLCLDLPQASEALTDTCRAIGGEPILLDISIPGAGATLMAKIRNLAGRIDVLVHNAGITRDRTLAKMTTEEWDQVVAVNLGAIMAIDEELLGKGVLQDFGRLVYLSSISGIAGNFGQSNYATTKAALIGYVEALADNRRPRDHRERRGARLHRNGDDGQDALHHARGWPAVERRVPRRPPTGCSRAHCVPCFARGIRAYGPGSPSLWTGSDRRLTCWSRVSYHGKRLGVTAYHTGFKWHRSEMTTARAT